MAANPETKFITSVHRHVPATVYKLKLNLPMNSGIADVWYSGMRDDLWVEYKYIPKLPKDRLIDIPVALTELQKLWLRNRHNEGRNVRVIVGYPDGGVILTRPEVWELPLSAQIIMTAGLTREKLAHYITDFVS